MWVWVLCGGGVGRCACALRLALGTTRAAHMVMMIYVCVDVFELEWGVGVVCGVRNGVCDG